MEGILEKNKRISCNKTYRQITFRGNNCSDKFYKAILLQRCTPVILVQGG